MSDTDSKNQGGRPSIYSDELAATICERMVEGESLRSICDDADMPDKATVLRWLGDDSHAGFRDQYARAREMQAESLFEEIITIADNSADDVTQDDKGRLIVNHEVVARARLRVDTRKWAMSKMAPKKYGDKVQHEGELTVRYEDALKELE